MASTVRDASLTTARRRQLALYAWRNSNQYSYNPQTQNSEQAPSHGNRGTGPTGEVPIDASLGARLVGQAFPNRPSGNTCPCATPNAVTLQGYVKQEPGC